jgi:hypothetical protein
VVAKSNSGQTVVTPLGFYLEPQYVDVTFKLIDRDGNRPRRSRRWTSSISTASPRSESASKE